MRPAEEVRGDIARVSQEIDQHDHTGGLLRKQLGRLLAEARDHPELTLEEGRQVPEEPIPRQTAYRLIRAADCAAHDRSKADPYDEAHGLDR